MRSEPLTSRTKFQKAKLSPRKRENQSITPHQLFLLPLHIQPVTKILPIISQNVLIYPLPLETHRHLLNVELGQEKSFPIFFLSAVIIYLHSTQGLPPSSLSPLHLLDPAQFRMSRLLLVLPKADMNACFIWRLSCLGITKYTCFMPAMFQDCPSAKIRPEKRNGDKESKGSQIIHRPYHQPFTYSLQFSKKWRILKLAKGQGRGQRLERAPLMDKISVFLLCWFTRHLLTIFPSLLTLFQFCCTLVIMWEVKVGQRIYKIKSHIFLVWFLTFIPW